MVNHSIQDVWVWKSGYSKKQTDGGSQAIKKKQLPEIGNPPPPAENSPKRTPRFKHRFYTHQGLASHWAQKIAPTALGSRAKHPIPLRQEDQEKSFLLSRSEAQAGEPGFEPGLTDPESVVLPLHYSPGKPLWGLPRGDPRDRFLFILSKFLKRKSSLDKEVMVNFFQKLWS